ncbi:uncharacterized protein [Onthophagus taurus]|uniref:uncharacterized protein n=1 Tax=Onthophagus taurus TaxID=166361 RepID=UPI0039BDB25B
MDTPTVLTVNYSRNFEDPGKSSHSTLQKLTEKIIIRSFILMQFQTQYKLFVALGIVLTYYVTLNEAATAISIMKHEKPLKHYMTNTKGIIYSFDVFYGLDVGLMLIYRNTYWPETQHRYPPRNSLVIFLDICSLVPIDGIYYHIGPKKWPSAVSILRMRYALRLVRIYCQFKIARPITKTPSLITFVFSFYIILTFIITTTAAVIQTCMCGFTCTDWNSTMFYKNMYLVAEKFTGMGFGLIQYHFELKYEHLASIFITTVGGCYFIYYVFMITNLITTFYPRYKKVHSFFIKYGSIRAEFNAWKIYSLDEWTNYHQTLLTTVQTYYKMIWDKAKWHLQESPKYHILPWIMFKDLYLELNWHALKHTHLFRNKSVNFLREVAYRMRHNSYPSGEVIYYRNQFKEQMVYIVTGIVQVISEENGETPIISFSGGTCLGESCLLLDYPNSWSVVCKTYCEIIYLKRKDFIQLSQIYPKDYNDILRTVLMRHEKAKRLTNMFKYQWLQYNITNPDTIIIAWIKDMLHSMVANRKETAVDRKDYLAFYPDYLDLLVIAEDLELVVDQIYLKTTYPPILQPESIFLSGWNVFMALFSSIIFIGYPCLILFCNQINETTLAIIYVLTTLACCWDAFVQSTTAVRTKVALLSNVSEIIYYRLRSFTFLIDIISTVPLCMFFYVVNRDTSYRILIIAEAHKLLKVYRISFVFKNIEGLKYRHNNILVQLKVFLIFFFLCYYTAIIFFYVICGDDICPDLRYETLKLATNLTEQSVLLQLYSSAAVFLGNMNHVDIVIYMNANLMPLVMLLQFIYIFVSVFVLCYVSIIYAGKQNIEYKYKEFVLTLDTIMKDFKIKKDLQMRTKTYLRTQFLYDKGLRLVIPHLKQRNMSVNLYSITNQVMFGNFLSHTLLFGLCDDRLIWDASKRLSVIIYAKGEVISYVGQISTRLFMIQQGFCKVHLTGRILNPGECFCVIETCLQKPIQYTVIAETDCKILSLSIEEYTRLCVKFPDFENIINETLNLVTQDNLSLLEITYNVREYFIIESKIDVPSTHVFNLKHMLKEQQKRTIRYLFLSFFLMRVTFSANGNFIFYWEISRMIFAYSTFLLSGLSTLATTTMFYILLFLDITSWIDLYFRLHVCYFNDCNIEVSHPVKTATHYLKNGFLLDLIASFPFDYLGFDETKTYLRVNRILQLHRPLRFVAHINSYNISRSKIYDMVRFVSFIIISLFYISNIGQYITCGAISDKSQTNCAINNWILENFNKSNVRDDIKQKVVSVLFAVTYFTSISLTTAYPTTMTEIIFLSAVVICGQMVFTWITAKLIANSFYKRTDLTQYQEEMKELRLMVSDKQVDKNIKNEIVNHFENMWKKTKGKKIISVLSVLQSIVKDDLLYEMFGVSLRESSIFKNAPIGFFKSLVQCARYEVFVHKGILYHVNDVHGNIFILLKGTIDIIGPDFNKFSILYPGSIFGNLDTCKESRQTLMMVASGNVEVLKITSSDFHGVVSKYRFLYNYFKKLTAVNVDYLVNRPLRSELWAVSEKSQDYHSFSMKYYHRCFSGFMHVYENTKYLKLLNSFVIFFSCFVGFHMELFQVAIYEDNPTFIAVLYILDLFYLLRMYLIFHTSITDDTGRPVKDRRKIAQKYFKKRYGFYFDLFTSLPFEVISLVFIHREFFIQVYSWLRKNRLLRLIICLETKRSSLNKLNVDLKMKRICYILTWLIIALHSMSCLLIEFQSNDDEISKYSHIYILLKAYHLIIFTACRGSSPELTLEFNMYTIFNGIAIMLICKFCITLFIAETCSVLENINQTRRSYQTYALKLKNIMNEKEVSEPFRKRIGEYFNLLWNHHNGVQYPRLLKESPYYLREAILNGLYGYHLRKHRLLKHCHKDLLRQMAATFDVLIFFPGNFITYVGDIDGNMYFIHKGEVSLVIEDTILNESSIGTLTTGEYFGLDQGLFKNFGHDYSYKATKKSTLIALNRSKWFHLLDFFPASKRVLFELRDEFMQSE